MPRCAKCGAEMDARATCARCGAVAAPSGGAVSGGCLGGAIGLFVGLAISWIVMRLWNVQDGTGGVFTGIVLNIVFYGGTALGAILGAVIGAIAGRRS